MDTVDDAPPTQPQGFPEALTLQDVKHDAEFYLLCFGDEAISELFQELPPSGLIGGKKFSMRPSLADAWLVRGPANFEGPIGATPNERCAVTEG